MAEMWQSMSEGRIRDVKGNQNLASVQLTFNKKSQGESKVVDTYWHQFGCSTGNQYYPKDPKKQIHGAVLPVHQLDPRIVRCVVEVSLWAAWIELFNQNT